jgi:hypothetical protein
MPAGPDRNDPAKGSHHYQLVDIVTDVVKVRFPHDEEISRVLKVFDLDTVKECHAELFTSQVATRENTWAVRLSFMLTVIYRDPKKKERMLQRLIFFEKAVPFPGDSAIAPKLKPRVEVEQVRCDAFHEGDNPNLEVFLRFVLILKGLHYGEIRVVTAKPHV